MKSKISRYLAILAMGTTLFSCKGKVNPTPGPTPDKEDMAIENFRILYEYDYRDDSVTYDLAFKVQALVKERFKKDVKVFNSKVTRVDHEIIIGRTSLEDAAEFYLSNKDEFAWRIKMAGGRIYVSGGGCWALSSAVDYLVSDVLSDPVQYQEGREFSGSVRGKELFPRTPGTDIRILDDNIWQYDNESNAEAWEAIGENCTNAVRSENFGALFQAYMPDIITLQEFSSGTANQMQKFFKPYMEACHMTQAGPNTTSNYTPIFYNADKLEFITGHYAKYGDWTSDTGVTIKPGNSKSYTLAVFRHKASGKRFITVSTHLWWKSNSAQPCSDLCREAEVAVLRDKIDEYLSIYNVPVFLIGDMNCKLFTNAMKWFTNAGYQPVCNISTADDIRGRDGCNAHHTCDATSTFAREAKYDRHDQGANCIDQFMLYDPSGSVEIKWFERIHAYFTIKLTDHYPNFADIKL